MFTQAPYAAFLRTWLFTICGMIFVMVMIGGLTRLYDAGLSITQWKPIHGTIPPLSLQEWQEEFALYQQYPEYKLINKGMSLAEFKVIFWWEYVHRLWGRVIGLAFALPLVFALCRWHLPRPLKLRLFGLFLLGGAQGILGWYMVKSGLIDRPDVSHFRLTAHLSLAFLVFSLCLLQALAFCKNTSPSYTPLRPSITLSLFLYAVTVVLGGLVAGLDAGLVYNTFPKMGETLIAPEVWQSPLLHNPVSIQFFHRIAAILLWGTGILLAIKGRKYGSLPVIVAVALTLQAGLGIATLLSNVAIPLAALHQANAVVVLAVLLTLWKRSSAV